MKNITIVFVTNYCPHYRRPVFEALSREFNVHFIFTGRSSEKSWNDFGDFRYTLCPSKLQLEKILLKKLDYDAVITNFPIWDNFFEFFIAKLTRKKLILWVEEWFHPRTLLRRISIPFLTFMARNCDAVVVCGSASKIHISDFEVAQEKIFLAPNASWVDYPPSLHKGEDQKSKNEFVILYLGRLVRLKGVDYLVKAFSMLEKEYSNIRLIIAGDGPFRNCLERLVKRLGVNNIDFTGKCDPKDRRRYYSMCDVFVLPSIQTPVTHEAWGLTLNEAMQFGKPVIATNAVGSAFDLIKNGINGFIVKDRDVKSLYCALKKILDNPKLAEQMGASSKKIVEEHFTYKKMLEGFTRAIRSVAKQKD